MSEGICTIPGCRGGGTDDDGHYIPARAGEGISCCEWHYTRYRDGIADLVDLYAILPDMLDPTTAPSNTGVRTKRTDPPAPLRLDVVALMDHRTERADDDTTMHVVTELENACIAIATRRGIRMFRGQAVTQMQRFLATHASWCAQQDWFPHLYDMVVPVVQVLRTATGMHPPKPVGRCHLPGRADDKCMGPVFEINSGGLQCRKCRAKWETDVEIYRFEYAQAHA